MKLYTARHGETAWNAEYRVCGRTDLPLTEKGVEQAKLLAEEAKGKGIDLIFASPMMRAMQTAEPVAQALNIPIVQDDRLMEQDYGIYEGVSRNDPAFLSNKRQFAVRYPGGESQMDLAARVYAALEDIRKNYSDRTVMIVCHGAVCRVIHSRFRDMTNDEFFTFSPENAKIAEYEW